MRSPFLAIVIGIAVHLCSCHTSSLVSKVERVHNDSTVIQERVVYDTIQVKADTIRLNFTLSSLQDSTQVKLINYLAINQRDSKNTRAKVSIKVVKDTVSIEASCDSIGFIRNYIERSFSKIVQDKTEKSTDRVIKKIDGFWSRTLNILSYLLVFALGAFMGIWLVKFVNK